MPSRDADLCVRIWWKGLDLVHSELGKLLSGDLTLSTYSVALKGYDSLHDEFIFMRRPTNMGYKLAERDGIGDQLT